MKPFAFYILLSVLLVFNPASVAGDSARTGYIEVPDGKLYYETTGSGDETVVLVHDGLVHGDIWDNQFPVFGERYRVIRYDRRGYGRSPKPEKPYSSVDDLLRVFAFLEIDRAVLVGMSAGGGLIVDFTLEYPDKVSALVVVGGVVSGFGYSDHMWTRGGRLTAADYSDPDKLLRYFTKEDPYEIAPQNVAVKEKLWLLMKDYPQNIDFTKNRLQTQPERQAIDILHEIQVPAFIVVGEFDIPDVFVHAGAIESGIPLAQKTIIRDAGHLVPLEQPESFNEQVFTFLGGAEFFRVLNTEGVTEAVQYFTDRRKDDNSWIPFTEARMNTLGYEYLLSGKIPEAIELFNLNVLVYPESANAYDSLGEAYAAGGDKELAIESYKKSLALNPDNNNARQKLEELK
jgi:pimeloyl-ACP methyl ester carboxylesterase